MRVLIANAHWHNRGDEAALRALIDELLAYRKDVEIVVHFWTNKKITQFPYDGTKVRFFAENVKSYSIVSQVFHLIKPFIFMKDSPFYKELSAADLVLYAPGGAMIGKPLYSHELYYMEKLFWAKRLKKPYIFYAPSIGPFDNSYRNWIRRYILNHSALICVREPISAAYLQELGVRKTIHTTLDSAFQHEVNLDENEELLVQNHQLVDFLAKYEKIVGITITSLEWSGIYAGNQRLTAQIKKTFHLFIEELKKKGYGVLFIPQLFGEQNDYRYMSTFMQEHCFILKDSYDCYFQQYLISRLYCVVGMRYHSNIFSAKMGTPFLSISYQEKMKGFMQKVKLEQYCLEVTELSLEALLKRFELIEKNYSSYKKQLVCMKSQLQKQSHATTDYVIRIMDRLLPDPANLWSSGVGPCNSNVYEEVEEAGSCVKCGMCHSVCRQNALKMVYHETTGFYHLAFDQQKCNHCGLCLKTCPVKNQFSRPSVNATGDYRKLLLGHATDSTVRWNATSGGCVNALIRYLLNEGKVEHVLVVAQDNTKPTGTGYVILNKSNRDVLTEDPRRFSSRYVSYPLMAALKQIENAKRIAVVGTPCQIMALENYEGINKKLQIFKIGIACSGGTSYKATQLLFQRHKLKSGGIYYRGDGWPGKNTIICGDKVYQENHITSLFNALYTSQIFRNPACINCNDQFARLSDISFFDFWNQKELKNEHKGNSGIFIRTELASAYFEDVLRKSYIEVAGQISEKAVIDGQGWPVLLKMSNKKKEWQVLWYYKAANAIFRYRLYPMIPRTGFEKLSAWFLRLLYR